jgi:Asp-tRNA(Asn)/Glu-tRNA(Gln) amidotransferase A subunit family amidase
VASRRTFLRTAGAWAAYATLRPSRAQAAAYDPFEKTLRELQADMHAGRTTAEAVTQYYLDRIAAFDQAGPGVNALLFVNPRALDMARALDREWRTRGPRGPLHGIPVLLKDNYETSDMPTTGGCLALAGLVPRQDAFQVKKLRDAGAVLLGKVNLHELALGLTTVSSLGGQTLDPYDLTRAPGGSSGGSGAAAAADFAAFAMGTDTSGSIRIPSSHNSIVGLRPSAGLSSRSGIIPFGHTQDTGGPMARHVADIAVILDATVGYDPADPTTEASKGKVPRTYTSSLRAGALKGARIGVLREVFGNAPEDEEVGAIVRGAIAEMTRRGATAIEVDIPDLQAQLSASNLLSQELKFYLGAYLRGSGAPVRSVEELLDSGLHASQLAGFLELANAQPDDYLSGDDYRKRLAAREALGSAVRRVMDANRLDALVYPTTRRIAPHIGGNQVGSNAGLSAQTGFPAITVPAGFTAGGFPVGVELLGRPFAEPTLLALAYSYEQATTHRHPPASTPRDLPTTRAAAPPAIDLTGADVVEVRATGAMSIPASDVPFELTARVRFVDATRTLSYELRPGGTSPDQIAGVYLHRRAKRANGGVAYVLAKSISGPVSGRVVLTEQEAADLHAGKCYIAAVSRISPRLSARANLAV